MPSELTTREARKDFATVVNRAAFGGERFVLTRCGKRLAAVVPLADLEHLEQVASALARPTLKAVPTDGVAAPEKESD